MYEVSWSYLQWFLSYRANTVLSQKLVLTKFKGNNSKLYIQELWFLHSACQPMLVNISMKFHEDTWTVWKLQSGHKFVTETATCKVQRGITLTIYIQELWFLRSARRLMWVNIFWRFMKISWMVFKLQSGHDSGQKMFKIYIFIQLDWHISPTCESVSENITIT